VNSLGIDVGKKKCRAALKDGGIDSFDGGIDTFCTPSEAKLLLDRVQHSRKHLYYTNQYL
jgi:hypothetical protein